MKHRIFLDINLRHWKYEKYCGGWMLLGHWYAAAAHSRLTPGSFNNRKTEKLDILTSGTLASRGRPERDLWSPGCGLRRWRRRSANLVWIPIQRDLIVNPLAPQSLGWWLVLVLHFTRPLLHKKHPPPSPASCYYQYYGGGPGQPPVREAGRAEVEVTALKWGCWW